MKVHYSILLPVLYVAPAVADYADNMHTAILTLQDKFYNTDTGLWKSQKGGDLWWQSGHILELVARVGQQDSSFRQAAADIIANTHAKSGNQNSYTDWENDYYDDMGWWAQGWIAAYDMTGDAKYLNTAKDLFEDMTGGWHTLCGGGIYWAKNKDNIASIANELFLSVAGHLANRVSDGEKENYRNWAKQEWYWFLGTGVINSDNLVNDGIDALSCTNDGKPVYTYNQGVVLAGLSETAKAFSDGCFITHAKRLAQGSLSKLTENNILTEPFSSPLDEQGSLFKGAYIGGLLTLHNNEGEQQYRDFFHQNADAVWNSARNEEGVFTDRFQGGSGNANAASHAAGIDVLLAAATT